jgi:hypothetical protein
VYVWAVIAAAAVEAASQHPPAASTGRLVQFIFTSDAHYGISRKAFRGGADVAARVVNRALVASIDSVGTSSFPADGGLRAAAPVGPVDFIAEGGDVCNREEVVDGKAIEAAATCWSEFVEDYPGGLTLTDAEGHRAPLFVVPGNHDASNAVGFYKPMAPRTDASSMVGIYNLMARPAVPLTTSTFEYDRDRVHASRDIGGVHFVFLQIWPDSRARAWMTEDLARVPGTRPVMIVVHDPPDPDSRHFRNPNGRHDVNDSDKFENLLSDELTDGQGSPALEQFLAGHKNVTAYFHGHSNANEFSEWKGPHGTATLHVFRVDSPMKGAISKDDETQLSFQVATIDTVSRSMTVREVLWNAHPDRPSLTWGARTTVALSPRVNPERAASLTYLGGDTR